MTAVDAGYGLILHQVVKTRGAFGTAAIAGEDDNFDNLFGDAPATSSNSDIEVDGEDDGDLDVPDFLR